MERAPIRLLPAGHHNHRDHLRSDRHALPRPALRPLCTGTHLRRGPRPSTDESRQVYLDAFDFVVFSIALYGLASHRPRQERRSTDNGVDRLLCGDATAAPRPETSVQIPHHVRRSVTSRPVRPLTQSAASCLFSSRSTKASYSRCWNSECLRACSSHMLTSRQAQRHQRDRVLGGSLD